MLSDLDFDLIQLMVAYLTAPVWDGKIHAALIEEMTDLLFTDADNLRKVIGRYDYCWWVAQWQVGLISDIDWWANRTRNI